MPTPSLVGFSVASGDLAILDRFSSNGVMEPGVLFNNYSDGTDYTITWDYATIAIKPKWLQIEIQQPYNFGNFVAEGSNDGTNWEHIVSSFDLPLYLSPYYATGYNCSTDKFYRWLRIRCLSGSADISKPKWLSAQWQYEASRPWSEDGNGGVGPGGDGGGANDPGGENDPSTHEDYEMSDLEIYAGDMFLGWLKGGAMGPPPDDLYAALFDGDPNDTSNPGQELTGSHGLTRQKVTFGSIVNRYMLNTNQLSFGAPDADITVACFGLYDAATGGNRLTRRMLVPPASITSGTPIVVRPGKLPVYY